MIKSESVEANHAIEVSIRYSLLQFRVLDIVRQQEHEVVHEYCFIRVERQLVKNHSALDVSLMLA